MNKSTKNGNVKNAGSKNAKRSNKKNFSKESVSKYDDEQQLRGTNHASWYIPTEQLLKDAASIPYSHSLGTDLYKSICSVEPTVAHYTTPGLLTASCINVPGIGDSETDAINVASRQLFAYMRRAKSGSTKYESSDTMMYVYAVDSLVSFYAWMVRLYGTAMTYSATNRYLPTGIIGANHVNVWNLTSNLSKFRGFINLFANRMTSLAIPAIFPFIQRHLWMYGNVFREDDSLKSQYYMYVPSGFWKYSGFSSETGGEMTWISIENRSGSSLMGVEDIITIGNDLLAAMIPDEDTNLISGDFLSVFGDDKMLKVPEIAENAVIVPMIDQEACAQFQNMVWANGIATPTITQANNKISCQVKITNNPNEGSGADFYYNDAIKARVLRMPIANPTPTDNMVATRMMTWCIRDEDEPNTVIVDVAGTEVPTNVRSWTFSYKNGEATSMAGMVVKQDMPTNQYGRTAIIRQSLMGSFACAPLVYVFDTTNVETPESTAGLIALDGEMSNFALVTKDQIREMHRIAIYQELGAQELGTLIT